MKIKDLLFPKLKKRGSIGGTIVSIAFIAIGIYLIYFAYNQPCDVAPITQTVGDQIAVVDQPEQMDRLVCLSSDYVALIATLIGTAMIFPGVSGLFRNLMFAFSSESKGKSKRKKK